MTWGADGEEAAGVRPVTTTASMKGEPTGRQRVAENSVDVTVVRHGVCLVPDW